MNDINSKPEKEPWHQGLLQQKSQWKQAKQLCRHFEHPDIVAPEKVQFGIIVLYQQEELLPCINARQLVDQVLRINPDASFLPGDAGGVDEYVHSAPAMLAFGNPIVVAGCSVRLADSFKRWKEKRLEVLIGGFSRRCRARITVRAGAQSRIVCF